MNIVVDKHNFNIEKINSELNDYCLEKGIDKPSLLKMQLISVGKDVKEWGFS